MAQKSSQNSPLKKLKGIPDFHFILDENNNVVPVSFTDYIKWLKNAAPTTMLGKHIAKTTIGDVTVSTVFVGINMGIHSGPLVVFESQAYSHVEGEETQWELDIDRYSTYEQAVKGHKAMVKRVFSDKRLELLVLHGLYIPKDWEVGDD